MSDAFNSLEWNAELGWWSATAEIAPGHRIDLHVQAAHDPAHLRTAVERSVPMWERLRLIEPGVRSAVADQLTEAHNRY